MKLKISKLRKYPLKQWIRSALPKVPFLLLYLLCFYTFSMNVFHLTLGYLNFNTTVSIRFDTSEDIPSITICGCLHSNVTCSGGFSETYGYTPQLKTAVIYEEECALQEIPVLDLLLHRSFPESHLIASCYFIPDSRSPHRKIPCSEIEEPIGSIQDGRKCFTFFSRLNPDFRAHLVTDYQTKNDSGSSSNEPYTWYIQLQINYSEMEVEVPDDTLESMPPFFTSRLRDADILLALHSPLLIPTPLDTEFMGIDFYMAYTVHFSKQITRLMTPPQKPHCQQFVTYSGQTRTSNECLNSCLMKPYGGCLNPYLTVTLSGLVSSLSKDRRNTIKYCNGTSFQSYVAFIRQWYECSSLCGRDCEEEVYSLTSEPSMGTSGNSSVLIRPERKRFEVIQHTESMGLDQFIGFIGGHCHLWLGLSAISLYDLFIRFLSKVKAFGKQFVQC